MPIQEKSRNINKSLVFENGMFSSMQGLNNAKQDSSAIIANKEASSKINKNSSLAG